MAMGLMMVAAYGRQLFGPVIPAELTIPELSRDLSNETLKVARPNSAKRSHGKANRAQGPRSSSGHDRWYWVGAVLLTVAALSKLWLMR